MEAVKIDFNQLVFYILALLLSLIPKMELGTIIFNSIIGILVLAVMIVWHEIGHKVFLMKYLPGDRVNITWSFKTVTVGTIQQINKLTDEQYAAVMAAGVLIGFIPMLIVFFTGIIEQFFQSLIFSAYMIASWSDIKEILKLTIKKRKKSG